MKVLIDTETSEAWEVGSQTRKKNMKDGLEYLGFGGFRIETAHGESSGKKRHTLTPIETPKVWELGEQLLESVPEELWGRVTEYGVPTDEDWCVYEGDIRGPSLGGWSYPHIILSPPEPEPKSYKQLVKDIYRAWQSGNLANEMDGVRQRLNADEEKPKER